MNINSASFSTLQEQYPAFLLDAYGVFWGGNRTGLLPGAKELMESLVKKRKIVGILSNTSEPVQKEIDKVARHGLELNTHFHFYITSGQITQDIFYNNQLPFATPRKKYWFSFPPHPQFSSLEKLLEQSVYKPADSIEEADFIIASIPHIAGQDQVDPALFLPDVRLLAKSGLPMICTNPDHFAHEGNPPRAVVRQGSIASLYESCGGKVVYIGKPYATAYKYAMNAFSKFGIISPQEVLMVGDTPETDIVGASSFGMASVLLTKTGMMNERIVHTSFERAINTLSKEHPPTYLAERFSYS